MAKSLEEIKDKLRKLYTMMEDGNGACQSEVESAMKVARKLMSEYKLSENDFMEKKLEVIKKMLQIKFSNVVNPWIMDLNGIVADNYCCKSVIYTSAGAKQKNVGLIGFADDVELCEKIMTYAVNCILEDGKKIKKNALHNGYTNKDVTSMINAYGNGYIRGIAEAFEEQNKHEEESFAMVMVTPQEVTDEMSKLSKSRFNTNTARSRARNFDNYAVKGYMEGKRFNPNSRLVG